MNWKPGQVLYQQNDIIKASEEYLLNHCHSFGNYHDDPITKDIFQEFKYADIYKSRRNAIDAAQAKTGKISIHGNPEKNERFIINMITQRYTGPPFSFAPQNSDTYDARLKYFRLCFEEIFSKVENLKSLAMSQFIGSGINLEQWVKYENFIKSMATKHSNVKFVVYFSKYAEKTLYTKHHQKGIEIPPKYQATQDFKVDEDNPDAVLKMLKKLF